MPPQMLASQNSSSARTGGVAGSESQQAQPLMEQAALLKQVMEMTREQIEQLPPDQQAQVLQLQALAAANSVHTGVGGVAPGAGAGGRPYM
jgi:Transcription termination and cleavage factor C-terminal